MPADTLDFMQRHSTGFVASGVGVLIVGLLLLITSVGIFGHRSWGRYLGLLLGLLGILVGALGILSANADPTVLDGQTIDLSQNTTPSIGFLVYYAIIFLGLLLGGGHFRLKQVAARE